MILSILFFLSVVTTSQAAFVQFGGVPTKITASGHTVDVFPKVSVTLTEKPTELKLTGAGIREKKILIASVNVYVLTSYTTSPLKEFVANPLKSIAAGQTEMLQMTLLRDLSAEKIRDSFSSALEENAVSTTSPAMKTIFANLNQDVKEGAVITILSQKNEGEDETLYFLGVGKTFHVNGKKLGTDFWKIWFGKPADSGLENLQKLLVAAK